MIQPNRKKVINSINTEWFKLTTEEQDLIKMAHPWYLRMNITMSFDFNDLNSLITAMRNHDVIEELVYKNLNEQTSIYKLVSYAGPKEIRHHWFLGSRVSELSNDDREFLRQLNDDKPVVLKTVYDAEWSILKNLDFGPKIYL